MKFNTIQTKEITDYEKEINVELVVTERKNPFPLPKYYVNFEDSEVLSGHFLIGEYGNGNTVDDALIDYCRKITNKVMVFHSYSKKRYQIEIPNLIHTKKINR